ncbi:MAG: hypothetical protein ACTSYD_00840 [Candidatus Heimdallarchaeaceae archaeon]
MLICLFKLEDIGPKLELMTLDKNIEFDEIVIEKFRFSGSITYSLVFQGMVSLDEMQSELYGPFPFAFSSGYVQYAFSFLVADSEMKDERMRNKTLGLLLMLVPEIVSKIDDFREELAKVIFYKFRNITDIEQVNEKLLTEIIEEYNKICIRLLNEKLAKQLSEQLFDMIQSFSKKGEERVTRILVLFTDEHQDIVRNFYTSLLSSLPYEETEYKEDISYIKTKTLEIQIIEQDKVTADAVFKEDAVFFVINIANPYTEKIMDILSKYKQGKIGLVVDLPDDLEKGSKMYAKFFSKIQKCLGDNPFFSANFNSASEFKHKMLEALFWGLSPLQ